MKDIDFDELDRAVSSLMDTVPKDEPASEASSDVTVSVVTPEPESSAPEVEPAAEPVPTMETETEESVAAPAARRGRFMDVMHPGAKGSTRPALAAPTRREAPMLQPTTPSISEEIAADTPATDQDQPDPLANFQLEEPDTVPLETMASAVEPPAAAEEAPADTMLESAQEALAQAMDDPAPLSSPFLPDAKVEKRPLGRPEAAPAPDAASELTGDVDEPLAEPSLDDPSSISSDRDAQLPEQPLPAELSSDLLSIETGGDLVAEPVPEPLPVATPEVQAPAPAVDAASAPASSSAETPRSMAVTSIPQQYKVQPSASNDTPASAIYDTQPLAHPAEKKPGWLWVLAIIGIILLGIGGGVAFYYLRLN